MTTPAQRDAQTHAPTCTRSRAFGAASFLAGLVFGLGLVLAGMTDPRKVLGFLDLAGAWDPSLAFVLGGAVGFSAVAFRVALRRARPWFADVFRLPSRTGFDAALVIGAAVFGIGWGLVGYCPGPAIVSLAWGNAEAWVLVPAMLVGAALAWWQVHRRAHAQPAQAPGDQALRASSES